MEKENKKNQLITIAIILVLVILIAICIYFIYNNTKENKSELKEEIVEEKVTIISNEELNKRIKLDISDFEKITDNSEKELYIYNNEISDSNLPNSQQLITVYNCKNNNCYGKRIISENNLYSITDGEYIIIFDAKERKIDLSIKNPSNDSVKTYIDKIYYVINETDNEKNMVGLTISREDKNITENLTLAYKNNLLAYYDLRNSKYVTDFIYSKYTFVNNLSYVDNIDNSLYIIGSKGAEFNDGYNIIGDKNQILDIIDVNNGNKLYHLDINVEKYSDTANVYTSNNIYFVFALDKLDILNSTFKTIVKGLPRHYNGVNDLNSSFPIVLENGNILVVVDKNFVIYDQTGKELKKSKEYDSVDIIETKTFNNKVLVVVKENNSIKVLNENEQILNSFDLSDEGIQIKRIEVLEKTSEFKSESGSTEKGLYIYAAKDNQNVNIYFYNPETNQTNVTQQEWFLQR